MTEAGPLAGVLVLDLSRALAGPHAAMMLADQGARVIKVEAPETGDDTRGWGPPFIYPEHGERESTYFLSCNRNKESIALDLKSEDGRQVVAELVRRADVLIENFRAGVLDRLGFDAARLQQLNPRLVVLSITGFGHDGPEGGRAGYDQIGQGEGGLMSVTGNRPDEPTKVGTPIADLIAGMYGAFGVLSALHERARTGRGTHVRTSLLAGMVGVHSYQGTRYTVAGEVAGPAGPHHSAICPYGLFHAADGPIQIAVGSDRLWRAFAGAFGLDRPQWARNADRVADQGAVIAAVEEVFASYSSEQLIQLLDGIGIPSGRVRRMDEVYDWAQTRSQGLVISVDHPSIGTIELPGPPLRYEPEPGRAGGRQHHQPPPTLNQHGEAIRAWLAATAEDHLSR
ncbi:MAG TPA: CoA transferase [Jatrophihabitans sp.]|nr:CoA transferase [Jatrophihabitans sp.]